MTKKILLSGLTVAVIGISVITATSAFAQTSNSPVSSLVQKIADKFNLNKSDVQAVFDQDRSERKTEMEHKFTAGLDQAVADGKLTSDQKQLIITKRNELEAARQTQMQTMQGKSPDEIKASLEANKATMDSERKSLEDWAKQNGIDIKYLIGGFGMHGGGPMPGMGMGRPANQ